MTYYIQFSRISVYHNLSSTRLLNVPSYCHATILKKCCKIFLSRNILIVKCFFVKVTLFVLTLHGISQIAWLCFLSSRQETISIPMCLVIVVQSVSHFHLSVTPWTTEGQDSLFFTISWSLLKLMSIFRNQIFHFFNTYQ